MDKVIAIVGPTASGKTGLSLRLAKKFHGEIISADSRQIYRGMDIGTAKATKKERGQIRHHLIDIKNPGQSCTVAHFKRDAAEAIREITKRGRLPFLVGGTGHYVHSLLTNQSIPEVKPNPKLRKRLAKLSLRQLFAILKKLDPNRAKSIDKHNPRRLIRAIEIAKAGYFPSPLAGEGRVRGVLILGIQISKNRLRRNINRRVEQMFRKDLVGEVKNLIKKYGRRKILLETIGYREVLDYLDGKSTRPETKETIKKNTWHYTKHQYNWFKRLPVIWVDTPHQAEKEIKKFLG